jgi:hypothetical protein
MTTYACKDGTVKAERSGGKLFLDITTADGEKKTKSNISTFSARKIIEEMGCDVATFDKEFGIRFCIGNDMPFDDVVKKYTGMKAPLKAKLARIDADLFENDQKAFKARDQDELGPLYNRSKALTAEMVEIKHVVAVMETKHAITLGQDRIQVKGKSFKPADVVDQVNIWLDINPVPASLVNYIATEKPAIDCDLAAIKAGMQHVSKAFSTIMDYGPNPEKHVFLDDIPATLDATRSQNVRHVHRAYSTSRKR